MIGIVAHTARAEESHDLMETVAAAYLSVDDGSMGCEQNHFRTWKWLADHTNDDWCVVLEDDAQPIPGFTEHLAAGLEHAPSPIVSLYRGHNVNNPAAEHTGLHATTKANQQNASWITSRLLLHAVAVAIRTELVTPMLDHITTIRLPIDEAISHYAAKTRTMVAYTHGSLVDHADTPSVITKHRDKLPRPPGRVAYQLGAPQWTDKAVTL